MREQGLTIFTGLGLELEPGLAGDLHLANDPLVIRKSGSVLITVELAIEYGFTDIDGSQPKSLSINDV